ncbi:MAG: aminopeptidase [Deferribacteraceae bacterium]|jgi:aminopeptidase|nr:aminopeptidase [Deferribacteraceae bacterium]
MTTYEQKLASLLCGYSLNIKKDDLVLIRGEVCAEPLIKACFKEVLLRGGHPLVRMSFSDQNALFFQHGSDHQFSYVSLVDKIQAETVAAQISIDSTDNSKQLTNADPAKVAIQQKVRGDLREIMFEREDKGEFVWVIAPYPTPSMAQDAEMSFTEYSDFVYNACKLNEKDPIAAWQAVDKAQAEIVKRLTGTKKVHIKGKNTDLTLDVEGRLWRSCCGQRNMPDGEVFTSPVENSATGEIYFDIPTNYNGVEANGVYLRLEAGKVVEARADKGQDFLLKMLGTDDGAKFVGEIAFGLNDNIQKPSKNILFDEKIGQTMHMAIGASYPETGGKNKSALHWDLIKDMKSNSTVELDGKLVYKDGKFV